MSSVPLWKFLQSAGIERGIISQLSKQKVFTIHSRASGSISFPDSDDVLISAGDTIWMDVFGSRAGIVALSEGSRGNLLPSLMETSPLVKNGKISSLEDLAVFLCHQYSKRLEMAKQYNAQRRRLIIRRFTVIGSIIGIYCLLFIYPGPQWRRESLLREKEAEIARQQKEAADRISRDQKAAADRISRAQKEAADKINRAQKEAEQAKRNAAIESDRAAQERERAAEAAARKAESDQRWEAADRAVAEENEVKAMRRRLGNVDDTILWAYLYCSKMESTNDMSKSIDFASIGAFGAWGIRGYKLQVGSERAAQICPQHIS
jgi:flagellar biosynthesis GTPase FlhF